MRLARALYRQLLRLLPCAFRHEFGAGMAQSFAERAERRTGARRLWFVTSAFLDVLRTAVAERAPNAAEALGAHPMDRLRQDVRFAFRSLRTSAGFSVAVVATLALGVGANIAVFSLIDAVLLRPLPVVRPDRLVGIFTIRADDGTGASYGLDGGLSYSGFRTLQEQSRSLTGVAGFIDVSVGAELNANARQLTAGAVSGNYFELLGVRPVLGRLLAPSDDRIGAAAHVVVLSDALFARAFARDPRAIGQSIRIGGAPFVVAGVAPQDFRGTRLSSQPELWVPLATITELRAGGIWNGPLGKRMLGDHPLAWVTTIGRRADTETLVATAAEVRRLLPLPANAPGSARGARSVEVHPLVESASLGDRRGLVEFLAILAAVVAVTLLIAGMNIANLTWTRTAARARELAVRSALGAGRPRLIWQLMLEHIILAIAAGAAALVVGTATVRLLSTFSLPGSIPIEAIHLGLSGRAIILAVVLSAVSVLLIGLGPALRASRPSSPVLLRSHGAAAGRSSRDVLIVGQVALTLILLVSASLFLRSLREGLRTNLGFEPAPLAAVSVDLFRYGYNGQTARAYYEQALASAAALPGIEAVALTSHLPLATLGTLPFDAPDGPYTPDQPLAAGFSSVTPDFFRAMGIPLVEGRAFAHSDARGGEPVAIINQFAAQQLFAGQSAIGREVRMFGARSSRVVGVVRDAKYAGVEDNATPMVYLSFLQETPTGGVSVVVKASRPQEIVTPLRDAIQRIDPHVALYDARVVTELVNSALAPQRFGSVLLGLFAFLGLAVAAVGIYSVVGYTVARRRPELGIRLALGATPHDVLRVILRRTGAAVGAGILIGVVAAVPVGAALQRFLVGVSPLDRWSFVAAALFFVLATVAAVAGPARRAIKTDPLIALRSL